MYVVHYWTDTKDYIDADSREAVYTQLGYTEDDGTHLYLLDEDNDGNKIHEAMITNRHGDHVATIRKHL